MLVHVSALRVLFRTGLSLAAAAALTAPVTGSAQGPGRVEGVVSDSAGTPIFGAEITVPGTVLGASSDERGEFRLDGLPAGTVTIRVRRLGFVPRSADVQVGSAEASGGLAITLDRIAEMLNPVLVRTRRVDYTGRLAGYYERLEKRSGGHFITREQIDRESPRMLSQLLTHAPSVTARTIRGGGQGVRLRGRQCWPLVWIDGLPMPAGDVDLDAFPPHTIHGIEIYAGSTTAPIRYTMPRDGSGCGTILLWSRGPDTDPVTAPRRQSSDLGRLVASFKVYTADSVERQATLAGGRQLNVTYPAALFAARVAGTVVAEFVVDANGRVERGTFGIVSSTHPLFSEAARQAVEDATYVPALRGGAPVRQVVQQPFDFAVASGRSPGG